MQTEDWVKMVMELDPPKYHLQNILEFLKNDFPQSENGQKTEYWKIRLLHILNNFHLIKQSCWNHHLPLERSTLQITTSKYRQIYYFISKETSTFLLPEESPTDHVFQEEVYNSICQSSSSHLYKYIMKWRSKRNVLLEYSSVSKMFLVIKK